MQSGGAVIFVHTQFFFVMGYKASGEAMHSVRVRACVCVCVCVMADPGFLMEGCLCVHVRFRFS